MSAGVIQSLKPAEEMQENAQKCGISSDLNTLQNSAFLTKQLSERSDDILRVCMYVCTHILQNATSPPIL